MVDYVARSALGSAFAPRPTPMLGMDFNLNTSPFQRRMVQLDWEKGLPSILMATDAETLLVDFIDERLELVRHDDSWVTDSPEARTCGMRSESGDRIRVGSAAYYERVEAGLASLLHSFPMERILVNAVLWSEKTTEGDGLPHPEYIDRHNASLREIYQRIDELGVRRIDYDAGLFVTDPDHRWGPSPFHYAEPLYRETLRALAERP
ncbi:DUF6270 domain-containing protein [Phycicoccus sp. Root101]|uniref:DUF6270 domain-containing protein n=1 Tax=Phycicoccus sp. Root101 TaxID=1736421 RepID=UPI0007027510|nr:DUF6270 domain-containing protein [Phycicoccus sp. Root101]KQU68201.1 hypothetical protein ASC58_11585 [Phycicoccus sp. Root101]